MMLESKGNQLLISILFFCLSSFGQDSCLLSNGLKINELEIKSNEAKLDNVHSLMINSRNFLKLHSSDIQNIFGTPHIKSNKFNSNLEFRYYILYIIYYILYIIYLITILQFITQHG
jgi:hypothetical protein